MAAGVIAIQATDRRRESALAPELERHPISQLSNELHRAQCTVRASRRVGRQSLLPLTGLDQTRQETNEKKKNKKKPRKNENKINESWTSTKELYALFIVL